MLLEPVARVQYPAVLTDMSMLIFLLPNRGLLGLKGRRIHKITLAGQIHMEDFLIAEEIVGGTCLNC